MALSPVKLVCLALLILLAIGLWSCSSYNQRIETYYASVSEGNYAKANAELDKIKLLKKSRNKLLYLLEKGRVSHALAQYDTSNYFFNLADKYIEEARTSPGDVLAATLVNPMMQKYRGEDFEKMMIHYYKALNYFYLGQPDEAVVEARRITLQTQQQEDKFGNKDKSYSKDTFSLMLQGMIYEAADDVNNAFISYRNAAEAYLKNKNQEYYGVKLPEQLKKDVLRTAYQNGFTDELSRFETLFKMKYTPGKPPEGGYLIVFWENGMSPVKVQQDFFFMLSKRGGGFFFVDQQGGMVIPFDPAFSFNEDQYHALHLQVFHVAFPKYEPRFQAYSSAMISNGKDSMLTEKAEDINEIASETMKQRFPKEMSLALSRLAVKKAAELLVRGKDKDSKKDKKLRKGISTAIDLYSVFSEQSDTRNWQTLPSSIQYARFPLTKGKNELTLRLLDRYGKEEIRTISVNGTGKLVFYNYASLK